jgi:membrane protease YdiL (CAAX protease family)
MAYVVAVVAVAKMEWMPVRAVLGSKSESSDPIRVIFAIGFLAVGVASVNWIMARIGHSRLAWSGWPGTRLSFRWFKIGVLVGTCMAVGMMALTAIPGGAGLAVEGREIHQYLVRISALSLGLIVATLGEEWLFRGYPLFKMSQVLGRGWANVFMASLFVAFHWGASGWSWLVAINIFMGSLVVGAMRFTGGGIPAAWGFHFAWNITQIAMGSTLSGDDYGVPMMRFVTEGPAWLTGGSFGPEGGVGATASTAVVLVFLGRYFRRKGVADLPIPRSLGGSGRS